MATSDEVMEAIERLEKTAKAIKAERDILVRAVSAIKQVLKAMEEEWAEEAKNG